MAESIYDRHDAFYVDFVDRVQHTPAYQVSLAAILGKLGELDGQRVCDLACGEGFLSRLLAERGALAEGHWRSGGMGVRGKMGAFHRMLSTYLNAMIDNGLQLTRLLEPMLPDEDYGELAEQWAANIPRRLTVFAAPFPGTSGTP